MRIPIDKDGKVDCPMLHKKVDGDRCTKMDGQQSGVMRKCYSFQGRTYNDYIRCGFLPDERCDCPKCGGTGKVTIFPGDEKRRRSKK